MSQPVNSSLAGSCASWSRCAQSRLTRQRIKNAKSKCAEEAAELD